MNEPPESKKEPAKAIKTKWFANRILSLAMETNDPLEFSKFPSQFNRSIFVEARIFHEHLVHENLD